MCPLSTVDSGTGQSATHRDTQRFFGQFHASEAAGPERQSADHFGRGAAQYHRPEVLEYQC